MRIATTLLIVGLALGGVTACGESGAPVRESGSAGSTTATRAAGEPNDVQSLTADEIVTKATEAARGATSVTVVGVVPSATASSNLDMSFGPGGSTGTMTQDGASFDFVITSEDIFIKGDEEFNKQFAAGNDTENPANGKWIQIPRSDPNAQAFQMFSDKEQFFVQGLRPEQDVSKGEEGDHDGVPSVEVTSTNFSLWVATEGEPFPIELASKDGKGSLVFSGWNEQVNIVPPAEDDTILVSELQAPSPS